MKVNYVLVALLFVFSISYVQGISQNFTASGTYTANATTVVFVETWGAGGGGGGSTLNANGGAGGGGGGAYSASYYYIVQGQNYTVNVGTGGSGNSAAAGSNGGDSWFFSNTTIMAKGGTGGQPFAGSAAGGLGGNASLGYGLFKYSGGRGGTAGGGSSQSGGGGGAGNQSDGGDASGNSGGSGGNFSGGSGGNSTVGVDGNGNNGVVIGGGGSGSYCDASCAVKTGGSGARGEVRISNVSSTAGFLIIEVKDVTSGNIISSPVNITLNSLYLGSYSLVSSNGYFFNSSIPAGTYEAIISSGSYNNNQVVLTVSSSTFSYNIFYLDSSSQSTVFNVRNGFGSAVQNATITFSRSISGSIVSYTQIISDSSGFITVNLNPTVLYLITGIEPSGTYLNYTASVTPNQAITYVIQFEFSPNPPYVNPSNDTYYSINATYNNVTKVINVTWEVISPIGDLQYFGLSTTYNGFNYSQNTTGIPGGGIAYVNISNVNLSIQDTISVTYWFKRTGYDQETFTSAFYFVDYNPYNSSIIGGLFDTPTAPTSTPARALLGMIIVVIVAAAAYSATRMSEIASLAAIVTVGILGLPAVNIFPLLYSVITVVVGAMLLLLRLLRG